VEHANHTKIIAIAYDSAVIRVPVLLVALLLTLTSADAQEQTSGTVPRPLSPRNASYTIDVRLDARARTLAGREILRWTNITTAETRELQFHLYYNAWRDDQSTYIKETRQAGGWSNITELKKDELSAIDVSSLKLTTGPPGTVDLTHAVRFIAPDDGNVDDRTVMAVALPSAILPSQSITLDISWTSKIPHAVDRTGVVGNYFFLGQWFPKIGVLQNDGKWNCHQFHAATEFFADYGVYDVRMSVPRGWPLAATGEERERTDNADSTTTYRYYQEDVHDFAWTTSPDYLERHERFEQEGLPPVEMRLMLQPEHVAQARQHFEATRAALRHYGEWFMPYPYGHITIIDPAWQSEAGGMEYPTLFTAGTRWLSPATDPDPPDTIVHETGHQWWYGIVGSNEFEDAWMDEGINTYANVRADAEAFEPRFRYVRRYLGGFVPWTFEDIPWDRVIFGDYISGYRASATVDIPSSPSYQYWPGNPGPITYEKTALWLHTLERALGWPTLRRILSTYANRWQFRHPRPADFFAIANEESGRDLTPFFDQVYRGSSTFDYGVDSVQSVRAGRDNFRTDVVVRRYGDGIFPVTVLINFADGAQMRVAWDGGGRWKLISVNRATEAVSAEVDPDQVLLLDTNFTNNSYAIKPQGPRAATKWAAKWMVWVEDQLLTWAFVI
jgi:hypothetical protein